MKNLAIISGRLEHGGAERTASNLSITLSKYYNVTLILFSGENITYPYAGKLIDLHEPRTYGKLQKLLLSVRRIIKLRRIKKEQSIDYSISLLPAPNLFNCFSKRNDKIITSIRNYMSAGGKQSYKRIINYTNKHSDKIVSLSRMTTWDLINNYYADPKKIVTIYNSCDPDLLIRLSNEEGYIPPSYKYIITTGRLMYQKGQWHLLRAFKRINESFNELHLIILGEGEYKDDLENLSKRLNIGDKVHLLGYVKNPHLYMKYAELFVFTSLYEGLGNVLLEALACGLPIVSTDCLAGPREILSQNCDEYKCLEKINKPEYLDYGIVVPPFGFEKPDWNNTEIEEEEKVLAETVVSLLKDTEKLNYYRASAAKRIAFFNSSQIDRQWIDLINSI